MSKSEVSSSNKKTHSSKREHYLGKTKNQPKTLHISYFVPSSKAAWIYLPKPFLSMFCTFFSKPWLWTYIKLHCHIFLIEKTHSRKREHYLAKTKNQPKTLHIHYSAPSSKATWIYFPKSFLSIFCTFFHF